MSCPRSVAGQVLTDRSGGPDRSISPIGIGSWQAGGPGPWGGGPTADDARVTAAIRSAVERGVTWIDTAPSYGLGHAEQVVAEALLPWQIGEDVFVFTKCGHPWTDDTPTTCLQPESIRSEVEGSLRRLRVDRLDMVQFHHPDPGVPVEESWGALGDLVAEGKVRWCGLSNFPVELLDRCAAIRPVDAVQPELSLLRQSALDTVVPWCRVHRTTVLAYSPLASGELARADPNETGLTPADRRVVMAVAQLAAGLGTSPAAVAVAWVLAQGVAAICGARSPEQVQEWVTAGELVLPADRLAQALSTGIRGEEVE